MWAAVSDPAGSDPTGSSAAGSPAAGPAAGRSCPGPCRRRARRRAPSDSRKSSQAKPRAWYGRSCPMNDVGGWIGSSRRSASPASRSPSQPSAVDLGRPAARPSAARHPGRAAAARRPWPWPVVRRAAARPPADGRRARSTGRAAGPAATWRRPARRARRRSACRRRPRGRSGSRRWRRSRARRCRRRHRPGCGGVEAVSRKPEPSGRPGPPARQLHAEPGRRQQRRRRRGGTGGRPRCPAPARRAGRSAARRRARG